MAGREKGNTKADPRTDYKLGIVPFNTAANLLKGQANQAAKIKRLLEKQSIQGGQWEKLESSANLSLAVSIPMIVMRAFTAELAIKAALSELSLKVPKTHNLRKLFDALPTELKDAVVSRISEDEFENKLDNHARLFEEWRYFFEPQQDGQKLSVDLVFLEKFVNAVLQELPLGLGS